MVVDVFGDVFRYKAIVEYCGTGYYGMQKQKDLPTIQGELERAIGAFYNTAIEINYAGRTDAGVHALGQVIDFAAPVSRSLYAVLQGINFYLLDKNIVLKDVVSVAPVFNSRLDAKKRYYIYRIINRKLPLTLGGDLALWYPRDLDVDSMKKASSLLLGRHNFASFRDSQCQASSPIKTLDSIEFFVRQDYAGDRVIEIVFAAPSFLHHMVRNIVGSLLLVGCGKRDIAWLESLLHAQDRSLAGETVSAAGLFFWKVDY